MSTDGTMNLTPSKRKNSEDSTEAWVEWESDIDRFAEENVGDGVMWVMENLRPAMEGNMSRTIVSPKNAGTSLQEERWLAVLKKLSQSMYGKGNKVGVTPVIRKVMGPYMASYGLSDDKIDFLLNAASSRQKNAVKQKAHREGKCQKMLEELSDLADEGKLYGIDVKTGFESDTARTAIAAALKKGKEDIDAVKRQRMLGELTGLAEDGKCYGVSVKTDFEDDAAIPAVAEALEDGKKAVDAANRRQSNVLKSGCVVLNVPTGDYPEDGTSRAKTLSILTTDQVLEFRHLSNSMHTGP